MVVVAMGDYEAPDILQSVAADLLEKGGAAVNEETGPAYGNLVTDALTHSRERAVVAEERIRMVIPASS